MPHGPDHPDLQSLLSLVSDVVVCYDRERRIRYVNAAVQGRIGLSAEQVIGRTVGDLGLPPGVAEQYERHVGSVFASGEPVSATVPLPTPHGLRHLEVAFTPDLAADGTVGHVVSISRDVTERVELASELDRRTAALAEREKELRCLYRVSTLLESGTGDEVLRALVEVVPQGFLDPAHTVARLVLRGRTFTSSGFRESPWALRAELRGEGDRIGLLEVFRLDERVDTAFIEEERPLIEALGSRIADAVRRQEAQEDLWRRDAFHRAILDQGTDMVTVLDAAATITYQRRAVERILGYTPEERIGRSGFDVVHADDRERVLREWAEALGRGSLLVPVKYRCLHRDGSIRWVESTGLSLLDDSAVGAVVVSTRDVTQRHLLQQRLHQAQTLEAVGRLAGGIAHEFNNLLTAIELNTCSVLEEIPPGSALREPLQDVVGSTERGARLTARLLAFGRREMAVPRRLDLNEVVRAGGPRYAGQLGGGITTTFRTVDEPLPIRADPAQIEQVLINLVLNAREAMPGGGHLTVRTERRDRDLGGARRPGALLTVSDTGEGIAPELHGRIFEPFFTTREAGTGLGLSSVYGIVQEAGGAVTVESSGGRGTTFRVWWPMEVEPGEPAPRPGARREGTILLVEDDRAVRAVAVRVLRRAGFEVIAAESGPAAMERASDAVDLLLTDISMPGMSGVELAAALRDRFPTLPVLLMSGFAEKRSVAGPWPFLAKPFSPERLVAAVREALASAG